MYKAFMLSVLFAVCGCAGGLHTADPFSDEPEYPGALRPPIRAVDSYAQALQIWKTPEDISGWMAANFTYDRARALQLSETQKTKRGGVSIYPPSAFFETGAGVCIDLARFGLETLRSIDPESAPKYLMVEFEPMIIRGNTLRLHWLVSFRRGGKLYFFADSKRPAHIAGPYEDTEAFIRQYEQYRRRKIVSFREVETYEKQRRTRVQPSSHRPARSSPHQRV